MAKKNIEKKPMLDALFDNPEDYKMAVNQEHYLTHREGVIFLNTVISPKDRRKYQGEFTVTSSLMRKEA